MTETALKLFLKRQKELLEKTTKGPLEFGPSDIHRGLSYSGYVVGKPNYTPVLEITNRVAEVFKYNDASFYVHATNNYPILIQTIERLCSALEFYADMNNYDGETGSVYIVEMVGKVPHQKNDFGEIARECLSYNPEGNK